MLTLPVPLIAGSVGHILAYLTSVLAIATAAPRSFQRSRSTSTQAGLACIRRPTKLSSQSVRAGGQTQRIRRSDMTSASISWNTLVARWWHAGGFE
jgi:hypothetical protein